MTNKLTDERLAQIKDMATDAGFCYGKEWDSALVKNGLMKYHAITSDFTENVVVWGIDDSLESSWLCDYLAALSPASVLALIAELQERRKAEAPGYPETLPCPVFLEPGLKFGKGIRTRCMLDALRRRADYYAELESMTPEQRAEHDAGITEFKAVLQGSQPVINRDELPCAQVKAVADLYALCWRSGEVVTYTPDPEKATIWLNNYSGTCVQEYVKLEDALETENAELQERRKAEASAPVMVAECAICGKSYTNANHPVKAVTIESPLSTSERAELQAFRRAACNHGFPPGAHTQGVIGCVKCSGRLVMMWEQPNGGDCES